MKFPFYGGVAIYCLINTLRLGGGKEGGEKVYVPVTFERSYFVICMLFRGGLHTSSVSQNQTVRICIEKPSLQQSTRSLNSTYY